MPRFKTDAMGNWVANPWALTFGEAFRDTRFNVGGRFTIPSIRLDDKDIFGYYPYKYEVCIGRSTVYNKPAVLSWYKLEPYESTVSKRPVIMELRRRLYSKGHPDECHSTKKTDFFEYYNCAITRNMRMEYYIPKYPMHQ
ncbi:hypothetical protein KR222_001861, partial [Zaprionus bogoriensis]